MWPEVDTIMVTALSPQVWRLAYCIHDNHTDCQFTHHTLFSTQLNFLLVSRTCTQHVPKTLGCLQAVYQFIWAFVNQLPVTNQITHPLNLNFLSHLSRKLPVLLTLCITLAPSGPAYSMDCTFLLVSVYRQSFLPGTTGRRGVAQRIKAWFK